MKEWKKKYSKEETEPDQQTWTKLVQKKTKVTFFFRCLKFKKMNCLKNDKNIKKCCKFKKMHFLGF